ncbi:uncharacterized protein LOC123444387 [Hordeum vulgare subsp. vulgare]|uniref:Predicted protein n=1 Tax=Hordeum vulgare subsp. vulgare TaxID=112509 RepID=F2DT79_HORVV|nr:uncharacterized protein LOC123444387 [Hordeum vulgare subsp. vulgare]BAJ98300.1 predicted protein [Hordeum vulgare subsp. vulgare]
MESGRWVYSTQHQRFERQRGIAQVETEQESEGAQYFATTLLIALSDFAAAGLTTNGGDRANDLTKTSTGSSNMKEVSFYLSGNTGRHGLARAYLAVVSHQLQVV